MAKKTSLPNIKKDKDLVMCYCRKCMQTKPSTSFFQATDDYLDSNGYFSICKDCCNSIYELMFQSEGNISRAILRCCRMFNVVFDESSVMATESQLKKSPESSDKAFGIYQVLQKEDLMIN
jgi:hypothetical protein